MLTLANGFAERGLKVDLVLAKAEGPYLDQVASAVRVIDLGHDHVSHSLPGLIAYLRRVRPQVLLSALNHANAIAYFAVTLACTGTRLVLSEHTNVSRALLGGGVKIRALRWAMGHSYRRAHHIVAVSDGASGELSRMLGVPPEDIKTIYNPVDLPEVVRKSRDFMPDLPRGTTIIAAGRLDAAKDYPTLLRAFAIVQDKMPATLVILGEGELRDQLTKLANELGISDRISMPGFVANPYAWMSKASLFVMSSAWEGLPTVLIEAMACGTPVVSTDCPSGPAEILEAGKWGRLVPVGDAEGLAAAMMASLRDTSPPNVAERAACFGVEQAVDAYLQILLPDQKRPVDA